jgi:hypothetical protein
MGLVEWVCAVGNVAVHGPRAILVCRHCNRQWENNVWRDPLAEDIVMQVRNITAIEGGRYDCEIEHPKFGWIPFTASATDCEDLGRSIHGDIKAGKWGAAPIYSGPSEAELIVAAAEAMDAAWVALRATRDGLLSATDWTQLPDAPVDAAAWAAYRAALRDLPEVTTDPAAPVWPTPPA